MVWVTTSFRLATTVSTDCSRRNSTLCRRLRATYPLRKVFGLALAPSTDFYGLRVGNNPAESFASLAALVVALEAQFAAANGGTNPQRLHLRRVCQDGHRDLLRR